MCLAVPARVVQISDERTCRVDVGGSVMSINRTLVDELGVGDFVLLHAGFAIEKYDDPQDALEVLDLLTGQ